MSVNSTDDSGTAADPALKVASLTTAEQFVVGVCRCWDAFIDQPDASLAWRELTPVFAYMNVMGALCAFERLFVILRRHTLRTLRFSEVDHLGLAADETRMLNGLACLQRGQALAAIAVLKQSLTPSGVRSVLPPLARIAAALDAQGHRLPLRRGGLRQTSGLAPPDGIFSPPLLQAR